MQAKSQMDPKIHLKQLRQLWKLDAEHHPLTVGQLTEDWERLQKRLASQAKSIGYDLVLFLHILRFIGENTLG